jgi:hypothetical protein
MTELYRRPDINKPINELNGLSVRKVANIIHNSLTLVEEPEELNYNTSARLYKLLTKNFTLEQKMKLGSLLNTYALEDKAVRIRLVALSSHMRKRQDYAIESEDDLSADIMANIMYRAGCANATFDLTGKSANPHLEQLVDRYASKKQELEQRGISIDAVLSAQFNRLGVDYSIGDRNVYRRYLEDFMEKYNDPKKNAVLFIKGEKNLAVPVPGSIDRLLRIHNKEPGIVGEVESQAHAAGKVQASSVLAKSFGEEESDRIEILLGEEQDTKNHANITERGST